MGKSPLRRRPLLASWRSAAQRASQSRPKSSSGVQLVLLTTSALLRSPGDLSRTCPVLESMHVEGLSSPHASSSISRNSRSRY